MANLKDTTINDNGFIKLPTGITGQRPSNPESGMIRFNSDLDALEGYDGISWSPIGETAGAVMYFAMDTAPTGWLKANGAEINRSTYSRLFSAIGTTFGSGDGSTTFNLPDLRGEFIRGLDENRGADPDSRSLGSSQGTALEDHGHTFKAGDQTPNQFGGVLTTNTGNSYATKKLTAGITNASASSESRPRNVALLPCIKF